MKTIEFNINKYVYVQLTEVGKKELRRQYDTFYPCGPIFEEFMPKEDAEGWSKFQLHELMNLFAHLCYNGNMELPFKPTMRMGA